MYYFWYFPTKKEKSKNQEKAGKTNTLFEIIMYRQGRHQGQQSASRFVAFNVYLVVNYLQLKE